MFAGSEVNDLSNVEKQGIILPNGFLQGYIFSILLAGCPLFFAGYTLATGDRRQDAINALKYMWGGFATLIIVPLIFIDHYLPQAAYSGSVGAEIVKQIIRSIFWGGIWTIYLFKSKRVRNTFMPEGGWKKHTPAIYETPQSDWSSGTYQQKDHTPAPIATSQPNDASRASMAVEQPQKAPESLFVAAEDGVSVSLEERFWEKALNEFEGKDRRPGLWAKSFSKAQGNEELGKAMYLEERVGELIAGHKLLLAKRDELKRAEEVRGQRGA